MTTLANLQSRAAGLEQEIRRLADRELQEQQFVIQIRQEILRARADRNQARVDELTAELGPQEARLAQTRAEIDRLTAELTAVRQEIATGQASPATLGPAGESGINASDINAAPPAQNTNATGTVVGENSLPANQAPPQINPNTATQAASRQQAAQAQAESQAQVATQRAQATQNGDWRVKLRLAGSANYLYRAPNPGILAPLAGTDGIVFPYMPTIATNYTANYNNYDLTHSNYRGYFYQGSFVSEISIDATFTAQDTTEANYLLAVIHFFRSVTKMFYGQDSLNFRGAPPPLVFLQGLGEFQFNLAPCVVQNFNYTLPPDVDYIRARVANVSDTNLSDRRPQTASAEAATTDSSTARLQNGGIPPGGETTPPPPRTLGVAAPTYVPTKMQINLTLLPIQTRAQVSRQFSFEQFANGSLIQRGFW